MSDDARIKGERELTARLLGVPLEELDYIVDVPREGAGPAADAPPASDENVTDIDVAAAEALGLVVPNRISYGVFFQRAGFTGSAIRWTWLGPDCARTGWYLLWSTSLSRVERAGYCRRPQTDLYDIRYKIYWRA